MKQTRSASERNCETITANPLNVDKLNEAREEIMRIVQRNIFVDKVGLLDQKNIEASSAKDKMEEAQQYEVFRILALRQ